MATSSSDLEPNLTECAVCHDKFAIPKILPCGHLLCRDCLVTWLQSQPQAACPLCRCVIVDPLRQEQQSVEEVADSLPTDLAMTAIVEAETQLSKKHVCCVCDDVEAVALCLQCKDMMCHQCRKAHKKFSATKTHKVEELSSLTSVRLATHHPATCPDHEERVSTSVCVLCSTSTHRDCPKLDSLQNQVGKLTAELAQLSDKLNQGLAKADTWLRLVNKHVEELQKASQAALDEMKIVCDRLKAAIDKRLLQASDMMIKFVSNITMKTIVFKQNIIEKRSKMSAHNNLTNMYKNFTTHKYFKDMVSVVKGRLPDIALTDSLPEDLQLNQKLILTIDPQAVADAERIISGLGDIKMTPANSDEKFQLIEVQEALASSPASESLALCIGQDFDIKDGNLRKFCEKFCNIKKLRSKGTQIGGVAILEREGRYLYLLITKDQSSHKTNAKTFRQALTSLKEHCQKDKVTKLSMPRISLTQDGLEWKQVAGMLRETFQDTSMTISVYDDHQQTSVLEPRTVIIGFQLIVKEGELCHCSESDSIAHGVSQDFDMAKGIAKKIKDDYGGVDYLIGQGRKVGDVAVLPVQGQYIYYLITKEKLDGKPTYKALQSSLEAMRRHCLKYRVTNISMPQIGCGRDGLEWDKVAQIVADVFKDTSITITVYKRPPLPPPEGFELLEVQGDLFQCSELDSMAHCVSQDLHMGKGIAVLFKNSFGGVEKLRAQGKLVGDVAVLPVQGQYVYYLITKEQSFHKPTNQTLQSSLEAMKKHCQENKVTRIAMPQIGCGLDRLDWYEVVLILCEVFRNTGITIRVYSL